MRILKFIAGYLLLSAVLFGGWILFSFPHFPEVPKSAKEWGVGILVLLLVVPGTLVVEALGDWVHDNRLTRAIEARTKGRQLSGLRILYNVAFICVLVAVVIAVTAAWRTYVS